MCYYFPGITTTYRNVKFGKCSINSLRYNNNYKHPLNKYFSLGSQEALPIVIEIVNVNLKLDKLLSDDCVVVVVFP